jgi:hypothetical protein
MRNDPVAPRISTARRAAGQAATRGTAFKARRLASAVAITAAVVLAGCGDDADTSPEPAQATEAAAAKGAFVGTVDGTDAYVALVSDGSRVLGYVCDSKKLSRWIDVSTIRDGTAALATRTGEDLGEAMISGDRASGTITIDGESHAFSAVPASGEAGLYRAARIDRKDGKLTEGEVEAGWIVLPDGTQRGGTNVGTTSTILVKSAPRLSLSATTVNLSISGASLKTALNDIQSITPIPIP